MLAKLVLPKLLLPKLLLPTLLLPKLLLPKLLLPKLLPSRQRTSSAQKLMQKLQKAKRICGAPRPWDTPRAEPPGVQEKTVRRRAVDCGPIAK